MWQTCSYQGNSFLSNKELLTPLHTSPLQSHSLGWLLLVLAALCSCTKQMLRPNLCSHHLHERRSPWRATCSIQTLGFIMAHQRLKQPGCKAELSKAAVAVSWAQLTDPAFNRAQGKAGTGKSPGGTSGTVLWSGVFVCCSCKGLWKCSVKFRADKNKINIPQSQTGIVASNSSLMENNNKNVGFAGGGKGWTCFSGILVKKVPCKFLGFFPPVLVEFW